jgi:glycosyltransferase involved in cell wall biosynthesis
MRSSAAKSADGLNVLLVSQPASDGVFRHVEALADYLLRHGAIVHLAYSDRAACDQLAPLLERISAAGGRTFNLRVGNVPSLADAPALLGLRQLVRKTKPDVVHAHSSKAGALVRALAMIGMKARVFYTPHAYYRMDAPTGAKARFFHAIERLLAGYGTTITVSSDEAAFAQKRIGLAPPRRRIVINGVDCARYRPPSIEKKRALRERFDLPADALVLGTVGRFSAQKDPMTTYAAMAKVASVAPELFFVHLGKGELEQEVDALLARHGISERCRRIPYLADTAPFYQMLDGFVLASLYEGMSFAVLESLASNLPVILTTAPGNQAFTKYGLDQIYWAAPANPEALAEAILAWRTRSIAHGALPNHRAIAEEQFSAEIGFAQLLAVYQEESAGAQTGRSGAP